MKILLAEDDGSISVIVKLALEKMGGHNVTVAADGIRALELALTQDYDLILLDSMMPGRDGLTVCRELKKLKDPFPNIIFMTAKSQESDVREGIQAGAIGYIQKPFDPKTISQVIEKIVSQNQQKRTGA